ncbi:MAG: ATP-binding protein [Gammaproteobacteria bacterium]|nr:ATP-binding protein [Gammaproteobacteria bacterium]NNJ72721.1 ATP-binding protein [Enterobacterales bacterium]
MKPISIVCVGAPSTGKSTLCKALAEKYKTQWVLEYGRKYWEQNQVDRRLSQEQLVEIAIGQRESEDNAARLADKFLFVDTEAIVTRQYAIDYYGQSTPELDHYADLAAKRYSHFFLCATDIPYEDNWARSGEVHRERFQKRLIADLKNRKIPFTELRGNLETRLAIVERVLQSLG